MGYDSQKSIVNELYNFITNGVFEPKWNKEKDNLHDEQDFLFFIEKAINSYIENYGGEPSMFSGEIKKQVFKKLYVLV